MGTAIAVLGGVGTCMALSAGVTAADTGTTVCAPFANPTGNGYWTPFGNGVWTGTGLQTTSQSVPSNPFGVSCGGASVYGNALPVSDPTQINALSFDFNANQTGPSGQAPRLVVCFSDGTDCNSNGNIAPTTWTANTWTHLDGLHPTAGQSWTNSQGSCGTQFSLSFSQIIACHPGATVTQVVVVNDAGVQYPSGEQVLLNNMTVNNVIAHEVPPVLGQSAEIAPLSGQTFVKQPGSKKFSLVKTIQQLRYGAVLHATGGHLQVVAATPGNGFESGEFYSGGFNLTQGMSGTVQASLTGHLKCGRENKPISLAHDARSRSFKLWGHVKGNFRTRGNYGSASVRGTIWLTEERCDGTHFRVVEGVLKIRDFTRHRTVIVRAGHHYLANSDLIDHDSDYFNDLHHRTAHR